MATTKEIKARITSVQDTRKITNAMYLISSTKLQRARTALDNTRPYFQALRGEITDYLRSCGEDGVWFRPADAEAPAACLVITADKGLAGAYNRDVLHAAAALLEAQPDTMLCIVGDYGHRNTDMLKSSVEPQYLGSARTPTLRRARDIAYLLLELYETGRIRSLDLIYTDMKNSLAATVRREPLLPLVPADFRDDGAGPKAEIELFPSPEDAMRALVISWVTGYVFSALTDSFCSEQNARMQAMKTANDNADELLTELSVKYNRVRQTAITQEITEISAGERAQKHLRNEA